MQNLFGFKKVSILSVAILTSFVAIDAYAADACGINLFNPQLLTEADFVASTSSGVTAYAGKWEHLDTYVSNYPFNFMPGKAYKVSYTIECPEESVGNTYLTFKLSDGTFIVPNGSACAGVTPGQMATVQIVMPADTTAVGMAVRNVPETTVSEQEFKISNVMVALSNQSEFVAYNPCIKLATGKSTETRMAAVENRLTGVRNTINGLITQMQTNTSNVGTLQSDKQTRPDDIVDTTKQCPSGKKCLLVYDRAGDENWYEIKDCNEDAFLSDVGNAVGDGVCGDSGFAASDIGCTATENWVSTYDGGAVFGVAKSVSVTEGQGQIVTLDGVSTTGRQCACRITGYNPKDQSEIYTGAVSVTTSKWLLTGVMENYDTDAACVAACARAGREGLVFNGAAAYYQNVGNDCYGSASNATACNYHAFMSELIAGGQHEDQGAMQIEATRNENDGTYTYSAPLNEFRWSACHEGGIYYNNAHCNETGEWMTKFKFNGGSDSGYVWGTGSYATVPAGTSIGDVVKLSDLDNVSPIFNSNVNAIVCTVDGYKSYKSGSTEQTINSGLAVVYSVNVTGGGAVINGTSSAGTACAEWLAFPAAPYQSGYYNALSCPVVANN